MHSRHKTRCNETKLSFIKAKLSFIEAKLSSVVIELSFVEGLSTGVGKSTEKQTRLFPVADRTRCRTERLLNSDTWSEY